MNPEISSYLLGQVATLKIRHPSFASSHNRKSCDDNKSLERLFQACSAKVVGSFRVQ
jgi:hypothetical protein